MRIIALFILAGLGASFPLAAAAQPACPWVRLEEAGDLKVALQGAENTARDDQATAGRRLAALYALGMWHKSLGNLDQALDYLDRLLEINPAHGAGLLARGDLFLRMRYANRAVADYTRASWAMPEAAGPLLGRARAWLALGRRTNAGQDLADAANKEPDNPDAHFALGRFWEIEGYWQKARASYRVAGQLLDSERVGEALRRVEEILIRGGVARRPAMDSDAGPAEPEF